MKKKYCYYVHLRHCYTYLTVLFIVNFCVPLVAGKILGNPGSEPPAGARSNPCVPLESRSG